MAKKYMQVLVEEKLIKDLESYAKGKKMSRTKLVEHILTKAMQKAKR